MLMEEKKEDSIDSGIQTLIKMDGEIFRDQKATIPTESYLICHALYDWLKANGFHNVDRLECP